MSGSNYYVPEGSKLPIVTALVAGAMAVGAASLVTHGATLGAVLLVAGLLGFLAVLAVWFRAVHIEATSDLYSESVHRSFVWGMIWFICSEVFFFATFFGVLFYTRVFVVPWLGGEGDNAFYNLLWPGFENAWPLLSNPDSSAFPPPNQSMSWPGFGNLLGWLPLWNTVVLVTSSFTCTIAHHGLEEGNRGKFKLWLFLTLALAVIFLFLQAEEYIHAYTEMGLTLQSGIYGTTFFMLTGFHGAHVTLGAIMLAVMLGRSLRGHFSAERHFGFRAAAWYWHFVDVVWVMLFLFVYIL